MRCAVSRSVVSDPMAVARQAPRYMGILQARILEWVITPSSRDLPKPGTAEEMGWVQLLQRLAQLSLWWRDTDLCSYFPNVPERNIYNTINLHWNRSFPSLRPSDFPWVYSPLKHCFCRSTSHSVMPDSATSPLSMEFSKKEEYWSG